MDWTTLNSSLIQAVAHDPPTGDLTLQFHNGPRFLYQGVSEHLADHLAQADSPGKFFHAFIKPNFSGEEITDE